ncbi:putative ficolin-2-like [Apostichopus japonicus]|uniref:Putative ficolin-2-like n=1 Tax=Stichopus japonicus TaxID=307972 RepID=A0A2G8LBB5_STIJA|nr:putative ficolin-2-like [Apostichopus japonicus]
MYFITQIIVSAEGRSSGSSYFVFQQPAYPRDCKEVSNACSSTHNTSGVYLIKPDGYPEPFEAYCNNDLDTGGWTVLQRRRSDSVNFSRSWKDFRNGFGFLGSDFWIGNEKIAVLTNQKRYQLRMDFENVAGETYYVTYDEFRISDEWGDYYISSLGTFEISDEPILEWCSANEIFSNETCERTCDDPDTCISATSRTETEQCVCVGNYLRQQEQCIPLNQCNCFVADKGGVLMIIVSAEGRSSGITARRSDSVNFSRSWKDFRNGFGFLGSDFWIGNEKIAVLTNQKRYQLRMDFESVAGETYYVTYDEFRISDEWGDYYISSLGTFEISDETIPEWCPANEIFSNETCERTCDDPNTCISATSRSETEQCVCVGNYLRQQEQCIPLNQCNCFVADKGGWRFLHQFRMYTKINLPNNQIIEASYQCSVHDHCAERNGVRKCYCNPNYQGDGVTCRHNCFVADIGSVLGVSTVLSCLFIMLRS